MTVIIVLRESPSGIPYLSATSPAVDGPCCATQRSNSNSCSPSDLRLESFMLTLLSNRVYNCGHRHDTSKIYNCQHKISGCILLPAGITGQMNWQGLGMGGPIFSAQEHGLRTEPP